MRLRAIYWVPAVVAVLVGAAGLRYVATQDAAWLDRERLAVAQRAALQASVFGNQMARSLAAAELLGALVRERGGALEHFPDIAASIIQAVRGITNLQLAPGGVVREIFPLTGHEAALGHDLLADPRRRAAALRTVEARRLVLAGPVNLIQGGVAVIGRYPVFLGEGAGEFWGFTTVLIDLRELVQASGLDELAAQGFDYQLARLTGEGDNWERFAGAERLNPAAAVAVNVRVPGQTWLLAIAPRASAAPPPGRTLQLALSLLFAAGSAWLAWSLLRGREQLRRAVAQRTSELGEERAFLATLIDAIPDAVYFKDAAGRFRAVNRAFERLTGRVRGELLGRRDEEFAADPWARALGDSDAAAAADTSGLAQRREERVTGAGGTSLELETVRRVVASREGGTRGLIAIARDISERRSLEEHQRLTASVFEHAAEGIFVLTSAGHVDMVNRAFERMVGWPAAELVGRSICELGVFADLDADCEHFWSSIRPTRHWEGEVRVQGRDAEPLVCWLSVAAIRDRGGDVTHSVGLLGDISARKQAEAALRESEARFRALVETTSDWVWEVNAGAVYTYASPKIRELLGYEPEEILGKTPFDLMPPAEARRIGEIFAGIAAERRPFERLENVNLSKSGEPVVLETSGVPILGDTGELLGYRGIDRDVSARKVAQQDMMIAKTVFDNASEAVMLTDTRGIVLSVNPAFTAITGYGTEEIVGKPASKLSSGHHEPAFYRAMWERLESEGSWDGEIWNRRRNGEVYPEWLSIRAIRDDDGEVKQYLGLFSDITKRKEDEQRIWMQANYDALTQLPNRNLFWDRLLQAIADAKRRRSGVGVLFVDLDGFKQINDERGHQFGDALLRQVARRLSGCVRDVDTIARFGGDEFTVVLPDLSGSPSRVATEILRVLAVPFSVEQGDVTVGASIGVALCPEDAADADTLIRIADQAMYRAKSEGGNRFVFAGAEQRSAVP